MRPLEAFFLWRDISFAEQKAVCKKISVNMLIFLPATDSQSFDKSAFFMSCSCLHKLYLACGRSGANPSLSGKSIAEKAMLFLFWDLNRQKRKMRPLEAFFLWRDISFAEQKAVCKKISVNMLIFLPATDR